MNKLFTNSFILLFAITIIVALLSASLGNTELDYQLNQEDIYISSHGFTWPLPTKYYISSYFGHRNLNIKGSSSYHSGIDIPRN